MMLSTLLEQAKAVEAKGIASKKPKRLTIVPSIRDVFVYYGFNSTGADREGKVLVPDSMMSFYIAHEQGKITCPEHKLYTDCKKDCKKVKSSTRKYAGFRSYLDFYDLHRSWSNTPDKQWKTFYEVIIGKQARKPYFDLDYKGIDEKEAYERLNRVKGAIRTAYPDCGKILTYESHGVDKFSFHVVLPDVYVQSNEHGKAFAQKVNVLLPPDHVDMAVYSSLQNFRLYGSTKRGQFRFKTLCDEDMKTHYTDAICSTFNPSKPADEVRNFLVFRDSLISAIGDAKLIDIPVKLKKRSPTVTHDFTDEEIAQINTLVPSGYSVRNKLGLIIGLTCTDRTTLCLICDRPHEHENHYITITNNKVLFHCRRAMEEDKDHTYTVLGKLTFKLEEEEPGLPIEDIITITSWPGRELVKDEEKWKIEHKKVLAIYDGEFMVEDVKFPLLEDKIESIKCTRVIYGGTFYTCVEITFNKSLKKIITNHLNLSDEPPTTIRVMEKGSRVFVIKAPPTRRTEGKEGEESKEEKKELVLEELIEEVKNCTNANEAHRKGGKISLKIAAAYMRIWVQYFELFWIRQKVEFCRCEEEISLIEGVANDFELTKYKRIWKIVRKERMEIFIKNDDMLFPWHRQWKAFLEGPGNKRDLHWIADYIGGEKGEGGTIGKSEFIMYMKSLYPKDVLLIAGCPKPRDLSTNIENARDTGWSGRILIIDITRSSIDWDIYDSLEQVCNGFMTSVKYVGKTITWPAQHIVVLSNWLPRTSAMTSDRWRVHKVEDGSPAHPDCYTRLRGKRVTLRQLTIEEIEHDRTMIANRTKSIEGIAKSTEGITK